MGGGGDEKCHQRECCIKRDLSGCWQCEGFPCHEGYFYDDAWKGLFIGLVRCVREVGTAKTSELIRSKMGKLVDNGNYRFKGEEEVGPLLLS